MEYMGEVIDRSWFDDSEAYEEGTYEPLPVQWSGPGWEVSNGEFYQAILRPNRIYLDEYPEQEKQRAIYFSMTTFRWLYNRFMRRQ